MKKSFSEILSDAWGVPKDVIMNIPRMTISGNKEIYIENHKGMILYTDTEIRLATAAGSVRILGKNLCIKRIRAEDALIFGDFLSLEYQN